MDRTVSIGKIVEFFPGDNEQYKLPNGMKSAAAIITQHFGIYSNLTVFVADPNVPAQTSFTAWSIAHKDQNFVESTEYWEWPVE